MIAAPSALTLARLFFPVGGSTSAKAAPGPPARFFASLLWFILVVSVLGQLTHSGATAPQPAANVDKHRIDDSDEREEDHGPSW
jgi:hypothetical protein